MNITFILPSDQPITLCIVTRLTLHTVWRSDSITFDYRTLHVFLFSITWMRCSVAYRGDVGRNGNITWYINTTEVESMGIYKFTVFLSSSTCIQVYLEHSKDTYH